MEPDELKIGERYLLRTKTGEVILGTFTGIARALDGDMLMFTAGKWQKAIAADRIISIQPA
jgi:hypothetical protein